MRYRLVSKDFVSVERFGDDEVLKINPDGLAFLANQAMRDVSFLLRARHLEQVAAILDDPESSANDKGVAVALLQNAEVASHFVLPLCQDTGTATIIAKKGQQVWTGAKNGAACDEEYLSKGVFKTYAEENLRYSQTVPLTMYDEVNSGSNLPAQIDIYATNGMEYQFLFLAKGGGSANKTYLFQETKALLTPANLEKFLVEKMKTLGTAACPPYHLAFVVGGTSAEVCLKTVKLASTGYLDELPTSGSKDGRAFRDLELEARMLVAAQKCGFGAQFGGKYFALDVRVIRLPRHGASCPVGMGVSCSADRNIKAKINRDGLWLEELERNPGRLIPNKYKKSRHNTDRSDHADRGLYLARSQIELLGCEPLGETRKEVEKNPRHTHGMWRIFLHLLTQLQPKEHVIKAQFVTALSIVKIDLNRSMKSILAELSQYPVTTQLSLNGTLIVARDIAHAKIKERLDKGQGLPEYFKNHPIYYVGPAKTPAGKPSGSFGPTTAGRMDSYVDLFQSLGGSLVMIAKGNRSQGVTDACKKHGGFYLGSIGGPAALLAERNIKKVELLEYPELGMEAIYRIEVVDFPAFILVDDKGNDFFNQI